MECTLLLKTQWPSGIALSFISTFLNNIDHTLQKGIKAVIYLSIT